MSEEPEDHGLIDEDPALDCILSNQMVKEDQRSQRRRQGGCLSLVPVMLFPLFSFLVFFPLCLLSKPSLSKATDKPDNYCNDPASWQQWEKLLSENPADDGIISLYAFRIGLCTMVKSGHVDTDKATKLFEGLRNTVLRGAEEANRQDAKEGGI
jgi:hypothetical protein